jgi:hypothetical protein
MAPDAATSDGYTSKSGTSMATPLMAGIAALMVEANPDLTHDQVKAIISADSIERDLQLLDDPGFNDCSVLESRPDNEFGYGQADPLQFVQSAGAIDSSLNITMHLKTLQHVGNESIISGISSGGSPGVGIIQIKVGGEDWQQATDLSSSGDWSSWNLKLKPHIESGNSTVYSRLVISDEQMSPVDARRVILIDEKTDSSEGASGEMTLGFYAFTIPFFSIVTFLGWKRYMTRNKG